MIASEKTMPDIIDNQYHHHSATTSELAQPEHRGSEDIPPFSIDAYADGLMDELFEDVEGVLDRGISLPVEPLRSPPRVARPTLSVPFVNEAPLSLANAISHRQAQWQGSNPADSLIQPVPGQLTQLSVPSASRPCNRLLMITTCASAVTALAVWGVSHGWGQRLLAAFQPPPVAMTVTPAAPAPVTTTSTDAQFAEYMQRSLEAITRAAANPPPGAHSGLNTKLPGVAVSAAPTPLSTLSRPSLAPLPTAPLQVPVNDPTRNELTQVLTQLKDVLVRLYPVVNGATPSAARPAQIKVLPLQSPPPVAAVPPALQRTLSGVLQAQNPDQSAALFEMNGVTQRYYPGESIGTSGWILVEIKNNQAVIRRNGDVKTIEAGQKLE
jgi:Type II secretion system protein C